MGVQKILAALLILMLPGFVQPARAQRAIPGMMRFSFRPGFAGGLHGLPGAMRLSYRPGFSFGLRGLPGITRSSFGNFYNPYAYTQSYLRHPYGFYPRFFGYYPYSLGYYPYGYGYYPYGSLLYGYPYGYGYGYGAYPYFSNPYAPLFLTYGALTLGALSGSGGYGGYGAYGGMLGLGLNFRFGGSGTDESGPGTLSGTPPPPPPSPAEKMQATILSATGLPTALGHLQWPLGLRILPGADPFRRRIDGLYEVASAQALSGQVNPLLPRKMKAAVQQFERKLALDKVDRYTLSSNQYEIAERFLHRLEKSADLFQALEFPKPSNTYAPASSGRIDMRAAPGAPLKSGS
jgi:hypothetical protein